MNWTEVFVVRNKQQKPSFCCKKEKKKKHPQPYEMPVGTRTQKSVKLLRECFRIMPSREAQAKQF